MLYQVTMSYYVKLCDWAQIITVKADEFQSSQYQTGSNLYCITSASQIWLEARSL